MDIITLVNGQRTNKISIHDRGLTYGDGVFETMLCHHGVILLWDKHQARLERGLTRLKIKPFSISELLGCLRKHLPASGLYIIKLVVTRGEGPRGYAPPAPCEPTSIVTISKKIPSRLYGQDGIKVKLCKTAYSSQPMLAGIKHLNRLEQVLAAAELVDTCFDEGLMLDSTGKVISATRHNLFMVKGSMLLTPELHQAGVYGVIREYIMERAQSLNLSVREQDLTYEQLLAADELFLTNSINGVWPICELDSTILPVGKITLGLQGIVAEMVPHCE